MQRVRIEELNLTIALPALPESEVQALREALAARPNLDDRVDLICTVTDFHRLSTDGPKQ